MVGSQCSAVEEVIPCLRPRPEDVSDDVDVIQTSVLSNGDHFDGAGRNADFLPAVAGPGHNFWIAVQVRNQLTIVDVVEFEHAIDVSGGRGAGHPVLIEGGFSSGFAAPRSRCVSGDVVPDSVGARHIILDPGLLGRRRGNEAERGFGVEFAEVLPVGGPHIRAAIVDSKVFIRDAIPTGGSIQKREIRGGSGTFAVNSEERRLDIAGWECIFHDAVLPFPQKSVAGIVRGDDSRCDREGGVEPRFVGIVEQADVVDFPITQRRQFCSIGGQRAACEQVVVVIMGFLPGQLLTIGFCIQGVIVPVVAIAADERGGSEHRVCSCALSPRQVGGDCAEMGVERVEFLTEGWADRGRGQLGRPERVACGVDAGSQGA